MAPKIGLVKKTNGVDANDPNAAGVPNIKVGDPVTWTYEVTNTGNLGVPKANVVVTDNQPGVTALITYVSGDINSNNVLDPLETWVYQAVGTALNLSLAQPGVTTVANSCTAGGSQPPRTAYVNTGTVTVPNLPPVTDPSSYCNPPPPSLTFVKKTNGVDANDPGAAGVPNIKAGDPVTWTYEVKNVGTVGVPKGDIVVTDNEPGVTATITLFSGDGNSNSILDPGETWIYRAIGTAVDLTSPPAGVITQTGTCTAGGSQPPRTAYVNIGTLTVPGVPPYTDPSSYCNPPPPSVTLVKKTNGVDANNPNAAGVPNINPGDPVTWTYEVTNTGAVGVPKASISVTDNQPGVTALISFLSGDGNSNNILDPGEVWIYRAIGSAVNLLAPPAGVTTAANSCTNGGSQQPRTAYVNTGTVTIPGIPPVTDPSSYCNPPPSITLVKKTNGIDANDPNAAGVPNIAAGDPVTWTYEVKNTGTVPVPKSSITVTDNQPGVTALIQYASGDSNSNGILDLTETFIYQAVSTAVNLSSPPAGVITMANSCTAGNVQPPRTAYINLGTASVPGMLPVTDPSSYCNPPPKITFVKKTNGADANDPNAAGVPNINPGATVTWTYEVKNIGAAPIAAASITVTDNQPGVTALISYFSGDTNTNMFLDPGETWIYRAIGTAINLQLPPPQGVTTVANSCTNGGSQQPRTAYLNTGTVTIGAMPPISDPSSYCNPPPSITLVKKTNGIDANDPNAAGVPNIAPGDPVTWTYEVKNIGTVPVPKSSITVTDNQPGVTALIQYVSGDSNSNGILDLTETFVYQAVSTAVNLSSPPAGVITQANSCTAGQTQPPRTAYVNLGTATVPGAPPVTDPSSYCNPGPTGSITIIKSAIDQSTLQFSYTTTSSTSSSLGSFLLEDCNPVTQGPCAQPKQKQFTGLQPGTYTVTEANPDPYLLSNITCVTTNGTTGTRNPGTNTETIVLTSGGSAVCTYTNTSSFLVGCPATSLQVPATPIGAINVPYSAIIKAEGGVGPFSFTLKATPDNLPVNLTLSPTGQTQGSISGTPIVAGKFSFIVHVIDSIGLTADSPVCSISIEGITIVKKTNGTDNNLPPGIQLNVGDPVTWSYAVKNIGPDTLSNVVVSDDKAGSVSCPSSTLASGATMQCTDKTGIVIQGQYTNTATVFALSPSPGPPVSASDPDNYFGNPRVTAKISIKKFTNQVDADDPNAAGVPNISAGGFVQWLYQVTNIGTVGIPQASLTVTDSAPNVTPAPILFNGIVSGDSNSNHILDPGEMWVYQATGTALDLTLPPPAGVTTVANSCTAGGTQPPRTAYVNIGTASAPGVVSVTDPSSYCNPPAPPPPPAACTLGYPISSSNSKTATVFNESEVLVAFAPPVAGVLDTIKAWADDEHALLLGVKTAAFPTVTAMAAHPSDHKGIAGGGAALQVGDPTITDLSGRPFFPSVYITDITGITDDPTHPESTGYKATRAGDWQFGGSPQKPDDIFGVWKGAIKSTNTSTNNITTDADPVKNTWASLPGVGGEQPPNVATLGHQGYETEVRWNVTNLKINGQPLQVNHNYRIQVIVHDGDQNKSGGDVGQGCMTVAIR
jgi:uncharacterized repeat protein (TIGR01451 family)